MAGTVNERGLRLLATAKALEELTDSENGISTGELRQAVKIESSQLLGYETAKPDKRTVYDDVETLKCAGYDIEKSDGTRGKYYLSSNFESWELRFLADAVRTSRSLTKQQGSKIVGKLKTLAPIRCRSILDRRLQVQQLYHSGSFKQTAYALDEIERAIDNGWKLSYVHVRRTADGSKTSERQKFNGSEVRIVDPIEYVYSAEGYYYLIILDRSTASGTKTPRIDRMADVKALPDTRAQQISQEEKAQILSMYRNSFGMFETVKPVDVTLSIQTKHVKSVADRFGDSTKFMRKSESKSQTTVKVNLSKIFYSWIAQFEGGIVIEGPEEARQGMAAFLKKNLTGYEPD